MTKRSESATVTADTERAISGEVITDTALTVTKNITPTTTVKESKRLTVIAEDIMSSWRRGVEEEFRIGGLLREAAEILPPEARTRDENGRQSGSPFGDWVRAQNFPFTMKTAYRLRTASEREPEVREFIAAHVADTKRDIGVNTAMTRMLEAHAGVFPVADRAAIRDLTSKRDEPTSFHFSVFRNAAEKLPVDQLDGEELAALAAIIKSLAEAYTTERARRQAA